MRTINPSSGFIFIFITGKSKLLPDIVSVKNNIRSHSGLYTYITMNIRTPTIAKISNLFCGIYQNENKIQEIHYKINSDFTESAVGIIIK